jgi:hypothetical protein
LENKSQNISSEKPTKNNTTPPTRGAEGMAKTTTNKNHQTHY